jgi:hypothetical protein
MQRKSGLSVDGLSLSIRMASAIFASYASKHQSRPNLPHLLMALCEARTVLESSHTSSAPLGSCLQTYSEVTRHRLSQLLES